jgi:hypothetical protein
MRKYILKDNKGKSCVNMLINILTHDIFILDIP